MNTPSPDQDPRLNSQTEAQLAVKQGQVLFLADNFSEGLQYFFHNALLLLTQGGVDIRVLKGEEDFQENALEVVRLRADLKSLIIESNNITDILDPLAEQKDLSATLDIYEKQVNPFLERFSETLSQIYRFKIKLAERFKGSEQDSFTTPAEKLFGAVKKGIEFSRIKPFQEEDSTNSVALKEALKRIGLSNVVLTNADISLSISEDTFLTITRMLGRKLEKFRHRLCENLVRTIVLDGEFYDLLPKADINSQYELSNLVEQLIAVQEFKNQSNTVTVKLNDKGSLIASLNIPKEILDQSLSFIGGEFKAFKAGSIDLESLCKGIGAKYTIVNAAATCRITIRIELPLDKNSDLKSENISDEVEVVNTPTNRRQGRIVFLPRTVSIANGRDSFSYSIPIQREFLEDTDGSILIDRVLKVTDYVVKNYPGLRNVWFFPEGFSGDVKPHLHGKFALRFAGSFKGRVHSLGAQELRKANRFSFIDNQNMGWEGFPISDFDTPTTLTNQADQESMIWLPEFAITHLGFVRAVLALAKEAEPTQIGCMSLEHLKIHGSKGKRDKEIVDQIYQEMTKYCKDAIRVIKEVKSKTGIEDLRVQLIPQAVSLNSESKKETDLCNLAIFAADSGEVIATGFFYLGSESFQYRILSLDVRQNAKDIILETIRAETSGKEFSPRRFDNTLSKKGVYVPESLVFDILKTAKGVRPGRYCSPPSYEKIVHSYCNSSSVNIYEFDGKIILLQAPEEVWQNMPHVYGLKEHEDGSNTEVTDFLEARSLYLEDNDSLKPSAGFLAELSIFDEALESF